MSSKAITEISLPELGEDFISRVVTSNRSVESLRESFDKDRYVLIQDFLPAPLPALLFRYAVMQAQLGATFNDDQVPDSMNLYGDPVMESVLEMFRSAIESLTGLNLLPAYAYCRIYKKGDVLTPHVDRHSCEISATLTLGHDLNEIRQKNPAYSWPIFVEGKPFICEPGSMLLYRGCELSHWREAFEGNCQAQLFIHYVDANGPFASKKFDTRPALGLPELTRGASSLEEAHARIQKQFKVDAALRMYRQRRSR